MNPSRKLGFALEIEDGWPPVSIESVWCDELASGYRLTNVPLFINGLAVGDVFRAELDAVNGLIFEFEVVQPSAHSLFRILDNLQADIDSLLGRLRELGCSIEAMEEFSLYAVDVPPEILASDLEPLLDGMEAIGLALAFPVWRRE